MPVANNLLTAGILAPLVAVLSGVSLSMLQRTIEWINVIATTPQKGFVRKLKPFVKKVDEILERVFAGGKFTVNATNILLMGILIALICLLLEGAEKPKRVVVVDKKPEAAKKGN
jgi:hypothetical protein